MCMAVVCIFLWLLQWDNVVCDKDLTQKVVAVIGSSLFEVR